MRQSDLILSNRTIAAQREEDHEPDSPVRSSYVQTYITVYVVVCCRRYSSEY